ncbi:hypothetical protein FBUS_08058 [Fasciolopsis buskii]|uniref:Uncharacterized protein n=1 Tax=Fasciolopsis buskii TaxID=27845 RepID=A0A8E0VHS8_9TREM|nr:hypothetical protein FBUS_08058 [Fasciolopsis buski]
MTQPKSVITSSDNVISEDTNHERLVRSKLGSLAPECDSVKSAYDACFQEFFPKFLRGSTADPCGAKLRAYQQCLRSTLQSMGIDMTDLDASRINADGIADVLNKR